MDGPPVSEHPPIMFLLAKPGRAHCHIPLHYDLEPPFQVIPTNLLLGELLPGDQERMTVDTRGGLEAVQKTFNLEKLTMPSTICSKKAQMRVWLWQREEAWMVESKEANCEEVGAVTPTCSPDPGRFPGSGPQ